MPFYSEKVMDHFQNPRNVGEIKDADGVGEVGNPVCGDMMSFYIKVKDNMLEDVKFKTFGCGAAIAVSSMVSDMAKGKTIDEALAITNAKVAEELGGLPPNKLHCSNLGADALHLAIEDYLKKKGGKMKGHSKACACPFCEKEMTLHCAGPEFCQPCEVNMVVCTGCTKKFSDKLKKCPHCGASKKGK